MNSVNVSWKEHKHSWQYVFLKLRNFLSAGNVEEGKIFHRMIKGGYNLGSCQGFGITN